MRQDCLAEGGYGLFDVDEGEFDLFWSCVDAEGEAGGVGEAEAAEEGLGAEVAAADGDLFEIEQGGEIEGMDAVDVEGEDREFIGSCADDAAVGNR